MQIHRIVPAVGVALILGLASGCVGHGIGPIMTTSPSVSVPAPEDVPAPPPVGVPDDCKQAAFEIQAALQADEVVTGVAVPSCGRAIVSTSLGPDEEVQAADICRAAAGQAGPLGVAAVRVVSDDGTLLAAGSTAEDCEAR